MLRVNMDNKDGQVWDISEIVTSVSWKTERIGKAGVAKIDLLNTGLYQSKDFKIEEGAVIAITWQSNPVFYGYVFTISKKTDGVISLTLYDQLRYLDMTDTYIFEGQMTASSLLKTIAKQYGLHTGYVADTKYILPPAVHDNKKLYDIICNALELTLIGKYGMFILYDDYGKITLRNNNDLAIGKVVGDRSLLTDYSYESSIDKDTYNIVMFVHENKEAGKRKVYVKQDDVNKRKWGNLKYVKKVDEKLNEAQIKEQLEANFEMMNHKQESLKLDAIGDLNVRAGSYIWLEMEDLGLSQYMLVDSCDHKFEGNEHTMDLTMKVVRLNAVNNN